MRECEKIDLKALHLFAFSHLTLFFWFFVKNFLKKAFKGKAWTLSVRGLAS